MSMNNESRLVTAPSICSYKLRSFKSNPRLDSVLFNFDVSALKLFVVVCMPDITESSGISPNSDDSALKFPEILSKLTVILSTFFIIAGNVLDNWLRELNADYDMGFCYVLSLTPQTIGSPGRMFMMNTVLEQLTRKNIWVATGEEIARYVKSL